MRVLRVGGVEEPFNLPWLLAFEAGAFAPLGVEVTFANYAGGTGALVAGLQDGLLDMATVLTEGGVTAIARGSKIQLHSSFVDSPLRWGVHISGKADQKKVAELKGKKFAISRHGSGSELMAYELAAQQEWTLKDKQFVVVGGLDGALEAIPKRKAHILLWERFVTAPHVRRGTFKRIGEIPTPWPSFYTATRPGLLANDRQLVDQIITTVLGYAAELKADLDGTIEMIVERYGMTRRDARTWLEGVSWPSAVGIDNDALNKVSNRMAELGRIEAPIAVARLL